MDKIFRRSRFIGYDPELNQVITTTKSQRLKGNWGIKHLVSRSLKARNIYVKELGTKSYELSKEEKEQGFEVLFNGNDLNNWVGNKTDYVVEDNTIAIYPTKEGHGNLNTEKEYSDFIFRFEFGI